MSDKEAVKVFRADDIAWVDIAEGIKRKTLALGDKMIVNLYLNEKGKGAPEHFHEQELTAMLLEGEVEATFGSKKYKLKPGDGYHIPGSVIHGPFRTTSEKPAIYIDILSPVRVVEGYADPAYLKE